MSNSDKSVTKTFGILTAGGDCPGLNAAIRGVCRAAYDRYHMNILGIAGGYRGLINGDIRPLHPGDFWGILTRGGTILGTSREKPFKSNEIGEDKVKEIKDNYRKHKLDALVVLGGNGTNTTGYLLAQEGLNVLGLPKTIDNDIEGCERSFGFHSAMAVCTDAIDKLHSTAESHNRVMVIETMGRKAGWLGLYSGIAGGGDVIIIPEIPYDIKAIGRHLKERAKNGRTFSIVVVAEGALSAEEANMEKKERKKIRNEMAYPSIAYRVAAEIETETGMETRATVLGYVQRGGIPSASDRVLATRFGTFAADMLARGEYGKMVAQIANEVGSVDLSVPAGKTKKVPTDDPILDTAVAVGTCLGV
ncbi:MAG: 6-phosphofructokinase [Treponema sp.]|nr:6-phosphofructokinase [Treponema sp.]